MSKLLRLGLDLALVILLAAALLAVYGWDRVTNENQPSPVAGGDLKVKTSKGPLDLRVPPSQQAVQIDDFAMCVRENRESPVSGEMGRRDMVIIEAIYKSAAQGGKRVEIKV